MLSFLLCMLGYFATPLGWLLIIYTTANVLLGPNTVKSFRSSVFAALMNKFKDDFDVMFKALKLETFAPLKDIKSSDEAMQAKGALNILEIGVGTGTNLQHYPAGSRLTCVDPNAAFEAYFRRECTRSASHLDSNIAFVCEGAERMSGVADNSVDVVVSTLVLCSVSDVTAVLSEIRRVLVPGGRLFVVEHVHAAGGATWHWRMLQNVLTNSGVWPAVFDGCQLNRDTQLSIEKAGFSSVHLQKKGVFLSSARVAKVLGNIINPTLYGVAVK